MRKAGFRIAAYIGLLSTALFLGCDKNDYTSWSCKNQLDDKLPMILKKAQMQFQDKSYIYCGSLGINTYFDTVCPARTVDSAYLFIPSTGRLKSKTAEFQCEAL